MPMTNAKHQYQQLLSKGWALTPVRSGTKQPALRNWGRPEEAIRGPENAYRLSESAGVLLAHCDPPLMALDIDDFHSATDWLNERKIDLAKLIQTPDAVQIYSGCHSRAKLLYRIDRLRFTQRVMKDRNTILEFRCADRNGGSVQDLIPPSMHPTTGQPYQWKGDWTHVPSAPEELLAIWDELLEKGAKHHSCFTATKVPIETIESILLSLDPDMPYDSWIRVGKGIHEATHGSETGLSLWERWSRNGQKYEAEECPYKWRSFSVSGQWSYVGQHWP